MSHQHQLYRHSDLKKKKNQIKTKTWEFPPTTHLHLLSLKSIILAHTTSIKNQDIFFSKKKKKNQDIPCPKIIHCYLGCHLKKEGNLSWDRTSILI